MNLLNKIPTETPLTDVQGEVRELSEQDLQGFRPAAQMLSAELYAGLVAMNQQVRQRGRPKAELTKERITIRLSPEVVQQFRATGDGWQTRIDTALKDWLKTHSPA